MPHRYSAHNFADWGEAVAQHVKDWQQHRGSERGMRRRDPHQERGCTATTARQCERLLSSYRQVR